MKQFLSGIFGRVCMLLFFVFIAGMQAANAQNISTVAGNGTGAYTADGVPATASGLHNPTTVAVDAAGNLYIADWANARLRMVNPAGIISTIAGTGVAGYNGDNIAATAAQLRQPNGVAIDAAGNIYVAEMSGCRVRKISGGIITTIAGTGTSGSIGDGGPATAARLTSPTNIAIQGDNIYIADWGNNKIRLVNGAGIISTIAGGSTSGFFGDGGPATAALLNNPYSVSLDASNNLYISDEHNYRLRKINLTTGIITTIAGNGSAGFFGDGGPATDAKFNQPDGIVADAGSLYIADFTNNRIRKVVLSTGIVTTFAGNGTGGFAGDGSPATSSTVQINGPTGIVLDVTGNVYISDFSNNRVRKISVNNHATTFDSGRTQIKTICDGTSLNLTSSLAITDSDVGQTETWSLYTGAVNGRLFFGATVLGPGNFTTGTSNGGSLPIIGPITYVHTAGMPLVDSFVFRVNDGISIDSTKIIINITPLPLADVINGPSSVCAGSSITLTDDSLGGTWISKNTSIGTITSGGVFTGILGGFNDTVLYVVSNSCGNDTVFKVITVSATPSAISPSTPVSVCAGSAVLLSDGVSGGTWSASNSHATISGSGLVTGVTAGVDTITYAIGSCSVTKTVTVNTPAQVLPPLASVCQGSSITLTDATSGGSWSSSAGSIATVNSSGLVTGVSVGTVLISYTVAGCSALDTVTVITSPAAIAPAAAGVCVGSTFTFTDATTGGTWSVTNAHASVSGGVVTGISAGVDTVIYTVGSCSVSAVITVNAVPAAITPAGPVTVCIGSTVTLGDVTPGGTWSSSSTGVATVNSGGVVAGVSSGTVTISYTLSGCSALKSVTVNGPAPIAPYDPSICAGATITLTDATTGGTWSSGAPAIATISSGGLVTGITAGIAPITYTVGSCFAVDTVTITVGTAAITPAGPVSVCVGATTSLADVTPGGIWSSSTPLVATVSSGGLVTGISAGTATITYTVGSCFSIKSVSVNPAPAPIVPSSANVCVGNTTTFTESVTGGVWSSSLPAVASVVGGVVTGLTPGVAVISYTLGSCSVSATVTVSAVTGAGTITGPSTVCVGSTITLTDGVTGGTWSSSSTSIATVSGTGVVLGVGGGIVTISYTVSNACGSVSTTATVNVVPAGVPPIAGPSLVCAGTVATFTDATTGGTWSSSNATATITGAGLLTGITPGTDTITYTVVNVCGTSSATKVVTIGPFLSAGTITGSSTVCVGSSITLSDLAPSGVWSSSNAHATVVGGVVTGVSSGVDTISYTVTSGCGSAVATRVVTVNPLPVASGITGPASICIGSTTTYTDLTPGGVWSVTNARATITALGLVNPVAVGLDTIKYTVTNSCGSAVATKVINIGAFLTAGSISGSSTVCLGSAITLTDPASGGVWSASNANATVSALGVVTGIIAGVDTISYTVSGLCGTAIATKIVTVNPLPAAGSITGPSAVCMGSPVTYTDATTGGVWSVSNAHATISGTGGILTPVSAGTDTISYAVTNACGTAVATKVVTIGAFLSAGTITGPATVCAGSTITLTDAVTGGTWGATNSRAVVTGGLVTGLTVGIDTITYTVSGSCGTATASYPVTINPVPIAGSITGASVMCTSTSLLFTDPAPGGVWSSSNATATVTLGGMVSAISPGIDTIAYTVTNVCGTAAATKVVTINLSPDAGSISGPTIVCVGANITLTDPAPGGTWSASNANATVSGTGVVTGVTSGMVTISYSVSGSCGTAVATYDIGVGASATAGIISGPSSVCVSSLITLTDPVAGGFWSSVNANATVAGSGIVTGIMPGTDTITYTVSGVCGVGAASYVITINALPVAGTISGPSSVCVGDSVSLTDGISGGIWSALTSAAFINPATGMVTGVSGGAEVINYTVTNACGSVAASFPMVVNTLPDPGTIIGPSAVCLASAIILTDPVSGGNWSAANTNASVSPAGIVTGLAVGTDSIFYSLTNMCGTAAAVQLVTIVDPSTAGPVTGSSSVCIGSGITLTATLPGGVWTSSNAHGLIAGPGVVDGVSVGVDTIYYTITGMCGTGVTARVITINPVPVVAPITGPTSLCTGSTVTLSSATTGGIWSSSTPSVATIGTGTGAVTGITVGVTTITYTVTNIYGCPTSVSALDTVNLMSTVPAITGPSSVCPGSSITLADALAGGIWTTSDPAVATVGASSGIVTGVAAGTATISYMVINTCGTTFVTYPVTVHPAPAVATITGVASECPASTTTLADATPAGVWSSSNLAIATVGSASGIVTGITSGTVAISYTVTNSFGCSAAATISNTVNAAPVVAAISGITNECVGSFAALTNVTPGGVWSSSNPAIATVGAGTGLVSGISAGIVTISYTVAGIGCSGFAAVSDTVNTVPVATPVTGTPYVCLGGTTTLACASFGGVWSSSNTAVATISSTGVVSGVSTGSATIYYTVVNSCGTMIDSVLVAVQVAPVAGTISGPSSVCQGAAITLTDAAPGGVWSVTNTRATVAAGVVTGVAAGIDTVKYTVTNACGSAVASKAVAVSALPYPGIINGYTSVCEGLAITLTETVAGGSWSTSNGAIASVAGGVVSGISVGTATISYGVTNSCGTRYATHAVGVVPASTCNNMVGGAPSAVPEIALYPNPAAELLHIDAPLKLNVQVFSIDGKLVIEQAHATDINVSQLADGVYLIKLFDDNKLLLKTSRFSKAR